MKYFLLLFFVMPGAAFSQHCPWDCSGMIVIQTPLSGKNFHKLSPVLVDENKKEIVDTIYGTGKDSWNKCKFLSYEDFTAIRKKKIAAHHWYAYDTVYHFTAGNYIVKFNYCEYRDKKLYIRFFKRDSRGLEDEFIEIPADKRIHLHEYNTQLREGNTKELKKLTAPFVVKISCEQWGLKKEDCK